MQPVTLEALGSLIFMRHRIGLLGLREPAKRTIDQLVGKGILEPVGPTWATPIVTQLKKGGITPIICDYRITVNKFLEQASCSTPGPEDIINFMDRNSSRSPNLDIHP